MVRRITASVPAVFGRAEPVGVAAAAAVEKSTTDAGDRLEIPHRLVVAARTRIIGQQTNFCIRTTNLARYSQLLYVYHDNVRPTQPTVLTGAGSRVTEVRQVAGEVWSASHDTEFVLAADSTPLK